MSAPLSDAELRAALEACASEPVRTPGTIQPIGYLLACDIETGRLTHASTNCSDIFGAPINTLFGQHIRDILGSDIWHGALNASALKDFAERRYFVGIWSFGDSEHSIHITKGGDFLVFEIEDTSEVPNATPEMLREQAFLLNQLEPCQSLDALFDLTVRLLSHITGYDRVLIYRFDAEWNGEVLAEKKKRSMPPFLGLRFPHWDIPAQAREIMARLPIRIIADANQTPVPIETDRADRPALDISLAQLRGVSPIHMQYLGNMGARATMTLSIVLDGKLWGMISLHHETPKVAIPAVRHILMHGVLPVFCLKLALLRDRKVFALSRGLDQLQSDLQGEIDLGTDIADIIERVGPSICETLGIDGLAVRAGSQTHAYGIVPEPAVLTDLAKLACDGETAGLVSDTLDQDFPQFKSQTNGLAGVLAIPRSGNRCLLLFRREISQTTNWAGNPAKTIETVGESKRLQPRGSFSRYLEQVQGRSTPWSENDKTLADRLWSLLSTAERQGVMTGLNRQQALMIGELNHRVRNFLALIKSVSSQSRDSGGTLESYSQALEARIQSLAAVHDISTGAAKRDVSVLEIIALETGGLAERKDRIHVTGPDFNLRADAAPIFTLVIHELMTNAIKYGALSSEQGRIAINLTPERDGLTLHWAEMDGPPVVEATSKGFGTTLISQALPYEMGGEASLNFLPSGVEARLWVPNAILALGAEPETDAPTPPAPPETPRRPNTGVVLILEDNFLIASDLALMLKQLGYPNTEIFARPETALEFIASETPVLALLDVALGHGQTSTETATRLRQLGVPVIFATGYGDQRSLTPHLSDIPVLTKPIAKSELAEHLHILSGPA